ncbi:MAG: UMP kinase [Thermoplasmata archaeon]|nr:UMP kinase [Thermoplasmata archaeon]
MDVVVISIGGSVLIPDDRDFDYLTKLAELLIELSSRVKLYVVVGGGRVSRYYIELGRLLGTDESRLDEMGVVVTRLNAKLLISALSGRANEIPPSTVRDAVGLGKENGIVVMGGTTPGHTTDGVAALLAEGVKADRIINATAVDGIYTRDPKKYDDAERIEHLTFEELLEMCKTTDWKAGPSNVFDSLGAEVIARSGIPLLVVDGRNVEILGSAILGDASSGTLVNGEE